MHNDHRTELTEALMRSSDGATVSQTINFLVGYISGALDIMPNRSNKNTLKEHIGQLFENNKVQLISLSNVYEIVAETISRCKGGKSQKNKIGNLESIFHECVNEIAMNGKYLREKWSKSSKQNLGQIWMEEQRKYKEEKEKSEKQSMALIKMIEEEQKKADEERKRVEKQQEEFVKKFLKEEEQKLQKEKDQKENLVIECQICLEEILYSDMGTLQCGHIFHRKCIRDHIEAMVSTKKIDIDCPQGCGEKLTFADINEFIDGDLKEKYERFSFDVYVEKNQGETSWCPTPGCTAAFSWEEELDNYRCPACKNHYCLKCRCNYHYGMSCAEYRVNNSFGEDDKKFEEYVRGAKYKQCPKCKFWVERIEGCSTMTCRCGHEFCYDCGGSDCPHGACKHLNERPPPPRIRPPPPHRPIVPRPNFRKKR